MISTSSSSGLSMVLRGPAKNPVSGSWRRPPGPAMVTSASSATSVGPLSMDGTHVTRLPPSVARFRVCTAPMVCAASANAGNISRISGERMISVCVTRAPILRPWSVTAIPFKSARARDVDDHPRDAGRRFEFDQKIGAAGEHLDRGAVLGEHGDRVRRILGDDQLEGSHLRSPVSVRAAALPRGPLGRHACASVRVSPNFTGTHLASSQRLTCQANRRSIAKDNSDCRLHIEAGYMRRAISASFDMPAERDCRDCGLSPVRPLTAQPRPIAHARK